LPTPKGAVRIETTRRYESRNFDEVLLRDAFGGVIGLETVQKGEVIKIAYPWLGAGNYANRGANFQALADLATQRKGTIWVDEWIHGYRDKQPTSVLAEDKTQDLWDYFAQRPIAVMAGQGVLLLLLLFWGQNQRFGALLRIAPPSRNSNEQYIQALADTLNTHGHTEYVLTLLGQSLRDRLKSRLSLVGADLAGDGDGAIAAEWATVTGRPASELLELLEQSSAQKRLRDSELLAWVQQADTILRGLS
jgi:outer membrane receptor protein involved in Fe transport